MWMVGVEVLVYCTDWIQSYGKSFSEQTMDAKSLSLVSCSRRCGTNHVGCGHAKDNTSQNIL